MRSTLRLIGFGLPVLAAVAIGGFWLYWHQVAGLIPARLQDWVAARQAEGIAIRAGIDDAGVTGFPARFDLAIRDAVASGVRPNGTPWLLTLPPLRVQAPALAPLSIAADFPGAVLFRTHPPAMPRQELDFRVVAGRGTAAGDFRGDGQLDAGHLHVGDAIATLPTGLAIAWDSIDATADLDWRGGPMPDSITGALHITDVRLPARAGGALGDHIGRLAIDAVLRQPIPPGRPRQALPRWRDAGGHLDVTRLDIRWGPLLLVGAGPIHLDAALQPRGTVTSRVQGFKALFDALAEVGTITPDIAALAKGVLGFLARRDTPDGPLILDLDITLQDGEVRLAGQYPVARYGFITWR